MRPASSGTDSMSGLSYPDLLRRALMFSHDLLRERDPAELHRRVVRDSLELLGASVARLYLPSADEEWRLALTNPPNADLPEEAARLEAELLPRAIAAGRSLISTHPLLDDDLSPLAARCKALQITTHLLLIRAHRQSYGAVGVHWLGKPRPVDFDGRSVFLTYWDNVGIAVATARERERVEAELEQLRRSAFCDRLTGLPNDQALQRELESHEPTWPLSVLVLDFDGLRAANSAFGNREGGDALIAAVGAALARMSEPGEYAARMYSAGDEFRGPASGPRRGKRLPAPRGGRVGTRRASRSRAPRVDLSGRLGRGRDPPCRRDARPGTRPSDHRDAGPQGRAEGKRVRKPEEGLEPTHSRLQIGCSTN